jgi:murein DD-endopeptidase MepM/ murein hydrolase activator NlpD
VSPSEPFNLVPVLDLPPGTPVLDLTRDYDPDFAPASGYAIGRYDEPRAVAMYAEPMFAGRNIHMAIDLWAPVGTAVRAFHGGTIHLFGTNPAKGDYGTTIITRHDLGGRVLFALWGHLAAASLGGLAVGRPFEAGDVIARIGDRHENGGWSPHLHLQLCTRAPLVCDLPGVVSAADREEARQLYPDPRLVLGPIYSS